MEGYIVFILLLLLSSTIKTEKYRLLSMFVIIAVFSSIRYGIGFDYYTYLAESSGMKPNDHIELIPRTIENWSRKTIPFLFFIITSIFISIFYYLGIKKIGQNYLFEVLFYVSFPFLFMNQLGVIRQGMATSVIFLAIVMHNEKLYKRLLLVFLAFFCHQSSIIALLIFLPWQRIPVKVLLGLSFFFVGASSLLIPVLGYFINLGVMNEAGTEKALNYLSTESAGEGQLIQYLIYFIVFIILVNYKRLVFKNPDNRYYIGLLVLSVILFAVFSFNMTLAKRLSMFFFTVAIFLIPQLIKIIKIPHYIYIITCILLFSLTIYVGRNNYREEDTGGNSVTYPYRTIFQVI